MPDVTVRIPGLLARFTDGQSAVPIHADTVEESVDRLLAAYPALSRHLLDGAGRRRPHVKLFLDGTEVDWPGGGTVDLADGDEVVVLQAVSGG